MNTVLCIFNTVQLSATKGCFCCQFCWWLLSSISGIVLQLLGGLLPKFLSFITVLGMYFTWAWTSFFWVLIPDYSNSALCLRFLLAIFCSILWHHLWQNFRLWSVVSTPASSHPPAPQFIFSTTCMQIEEVQMVYIILAFVDVHRYLLHFTAMLYCYYSYVLLAVSCHHIEHKRVLVEVM